MLQLLHARRLAQTVLPDVPSAPRRRRQRCVVFLWIGLHARLWTNAVSRSTTLDRVQPRLDIGRRAAGGWTEAGGLYSTFFAVQSVAGLVPMSKGKTCGRGDSSPELAACRGCTRLQPRCLDVGERHIAWFNAESKSQWMNEIARFGHT